MPQFIVIERGDDQWVTSYDVWAKLGVTPIEEGDGTFVGNFFISPHETSVGVTLDKPSDQNWKFAAVTIYQRSKGVFASLSGS